MVEDFNLTKWLAQEAARDKLVMAGYRGEAPYITFLFARAVTPIVMFIGAVLYVFVISQMEQIAADQDRHLRRRGLSRHAGADDLPEERDQQAAASIKRAFPDALDLLLICVESGMSVEVAFRKVAAEIGTQSIALVGGVRAHHGRAVLPAGPQDGL